MSARANLGLLSLLVLVCAACSTSASPTTPAAIVATPRPTPTAAPPSAAVSNAATATTEVHPTATQTATQTAVASADADACSGLPDNRSFFAELARQVRWAVYCAVLPTGWYIQNGTYLLTAGGQLTISYHGPGGVSLQLKEGAYCSDESTVCQPKVEAVGPTLFGDLTGTLYTLQPGYAVYVNDATKPPSWAAATVDLDESTFVKLVAGLHHVLP